MKIKAINPEIIVSGDAKKPYFQIRYYDTADNLYHIGYGSYEYGNVLRWLEECFEVIEADEQPVVHGKWFGTVCTACGESTSFYYDCAYCPNCGAKMDEEDNNG